jgi:hypothetical protein
MRDTVTHLLRIQSVLDTAHPKPDVCRWSLQTTHPRLKKFNKESL